MDYFDAIAGLLIITSGFLAGYMKGYKDAKLEWYYRGKNVGQQVSRNASV